MEPISCFPKGFCAQQPCCGQGPQDGLFWWPGPGLHSEHTSSRSRCKSVLTCTMSEEAGGREGSLDQIAGQVNTCLFFLLYLSEVHVKKIPVEDS